MTERVVRFEHVTRRFTRGGSHDALRDALGGLFGRRGEDRSFLALDDVSFHADRGEAIGIVGPNGSGKSTSLKLLTGILLPTAGHVSVAGRIAPLIEVGAGFHPDLTGRENIHLNGAILGMSRAEVKAAMDPVVRFSELGAFLDTPVKRYSSGMYMRLGFSIAAHMPADVLLVDEVLAVGDVGFRARCLERMTELKRSGRTILFVSHHVYQVRQLCDRVVYLNHGKLLYDGDPVTGTQMYTEDLLHPNRDRVTTEARDPGRARPAEIRSSAVVDVDGGPPRRPEHPLVVRVRYRVREPLAAPPVLSVSAVRLSDGITVTVLNSLQKGVTLPGTAGEHDVLARIEDLPFFAGRHSIEVTLWDAGMVAILDQSVAGDVNLEGAAPPPFNRPGAYLPDGSFTVGPATAATNGSADA